MPSAPKQPPYKRLVNPAADAAGCDRRFRYLNGGGRGDETTTHAGAEYRPAFCLHGWPAQPRQPDWLHNTMHTRYGCYGWIKDYDKVDSWDCGYLEDGIVGSTW